MMHLLATVPVLVLFVVLGHVAAECPVGPSLWCSSMDVATQCGVQHACQKHEWQVSDTTAAPVKLELYFESLCPGCRQFIKDQLYPVYLKIGSIMDIHLIPYGNAKETGGSPWTYTCQHGPQECVGNLYDTCSIYLLQSTAKYLPYIHCMELNANMSDMSAPAKKCASMGLVTQSEFRAIDVCARGRLGNLLEHTMAVKTEQTNRIYVPWIVLNGVHNKKEQIAVQSNLLNTICKTYKGPKPAACAATNQMTMT